MSLKKTLLRSPLVQDIVFWRDYYRGMLNYALRREETLRRRFVRKCGYEPDLKQPKTYNEKLQWLKLHWRDPLAEQCADKIEARKYVASLGYDGALIPMLGAYSSAREIDFSALPDSFVLKAAHCSGMVSLCADKARYDIRRARRDCARWLKINYYNYSAEWVYKHMPKRVLAERLLESEDGSLPCDYKIYCFHGEPKCVMVASGRMENSLCMDFFTPQWERMPFKRHNPNSTVPPERPAQLEEMLAMARKLSAPFPHARVDLYSVQGKIYFGEITFFPATGMQPFEPFEYDLLFGSWLDLSRVEKKK